MSRRLLQRGRYPKAPGFDQINSSNSQNPPTQVTQPLQPGVGYYDPAVQSQPDQKSWNQPPYSNSSNYQPQPHVSTNPPPAPDQSNNWSETQMFPRTMQAPWNETWTSNTDSTAYNPGYSEYQQTPNVVQPPQQWQQTSYAPIDNQNYTQPNIGSCNSQTQQQYVYQSSSNTSDFQPANNSTGYQPTCNAADYNFTDNKTNYQPPSNTIGYQTSNNTSNYQSSNVDYHSTDNISDYQPSSNHQSTNNVSTYQPTNESNMLSGASLQNWENGTVTITQPEELPWTYSTPQYSNPTSGDFIQTSNPPTNASWHPSVNACQESGSNVQNAILPNYLAEEAGNSEMAFGNQVSTNQIDPGVCESSQLNLGSSSITQEEAYDKDYASSTLSAFFNPSDVVQPDSDYPDQESQDATSVTQNDESSNQESRSSPGVVTDNSNSLSLNSSSEKDCLEYGGKDFVQEECLENPDLDEKSASQSPIEEPINQEVPEPCKNTLPNMISQNNTEKGEPCDEPLNQQVPSRSNQSSPSRSTSVERERMVIRPREDSPFKPPRPNSIVVQQEVISPNPVEVKPIEEKTVVQEVNLETFPDNLERPSDYEVKELRKQSPLYTSHKHIRQELNSSPSSLLCDNPDIPCVTLAPAAPPISSAKSDKSESSIDSIDRGSRNSSNLSYRLQEVGSKNSEPIVKSGSLEKLVKNKENSPERDIHFNPAPAESSISRGSEHNIPRQEHHKSKMYDRQQMPLRDSKIHSKAQTNGRYESLARNATLDYSETSSAGDSPRKGESSSRNLDSHHESRQRFADQKYYSYDERQYYSDRDNSRPSSRNSVRSRRDEYPYQPRHDDYPIHPGRNDPRAAEFPRPSSRMSETEINRGDRSGQYGDYYRQQYPYPPSQYPRDREASYYQRPPPQKGYEYDPYQRDMYYASYYDAYQRYAYNNFSYGFYDEMYRNDPRYRQYQEQYRQYYAKQAYDEYERSSVHSGRSSANELSKECNSSHYPDIDSNESEMSAYNLQQGYSYNDGQNDLSNADLTSTPSSRLTPVKFSYAHPIARFSPGGLLITAVPSHISTAAVMPIRIHNLQEIRESEESFQELKNYQGPLIRGSTHKNDVIDFCSQKIKASKTKEDIVDRDSYILLWELMILLLRQNGSVAGSDIAELLLKDHEVLRSTSVPLKHNIDTPIGEQQSPADVNDSSSQSHAGDTSSPDEGIVVLHDKSILNHSKTVDVDKITRKFREFLLFGHKKDALEWAMKHGLWGHALFLASKMDLRTYANVMTRFANSLALNDPLQTLYQLMSGRQPLAVTNVADKKWGDWRPHLAMILSNPSTHPEVDSRSITTLGDTLASKGCLCAAHFCYVMAQVEFGTFEQKNSKLVLLSANHLLSFDEFATNEAIQCTEIYEYAQSLANPGFMLTHLQFYKFLYAMRLVDHGFLEEALHYCEIIASKLQDYPHLFQHDFINEILKLATSLKYHDPHFLRGQGEFEEQDDPEWLKNLSTLVQNFNNTITSADNYSNSYNEPQAEVSENFNTEPQLYPSPPVENSYPTNVANSSIQSDSNSYNQNNYYQPNDWNQQNSNFSNSAYTASGMPENSGYYNRNDIVNSQSNYRENSIPSHEENETTDVPSSPVTQTPPFDYYSGGTQQGQEAKPLYEVPSYTNTSLQRERRDSALSSGSRYSSGSMSTQNISSSKEMKKPEIKKEKASTQAGKTWLGGIFNMLLPKGPNQMILPDDKNPTIVWDEKNKKWVDKDGNSEESSAPLAPPKDSELMGSMSSETTFSNPINNSMPPTSSVTSNNSVPPTSSSQPLQVNKFQRPKTRGMRQNYVDVLSNSGAIKKTNVPKELFTPTYDNTAAPNLFMPQPAPVSSDNPSNLEPSYPTYSSPQPEQNESPENQGQPLMFNPADFDARRSSISSQRHTLGRTGRRTYPT